MILVFGRAAVEAEGGAGGAAAVQTEHVAFAPRAVAVGATHGEERRV